VQCCLLQLTRWGIVLGVTAATYQFLTNLHTVPITGRTQVVVISREYECVRLERLVQGLGAFLSRLLWLLQELGNDAAGAVLAGAKTIEEGPQLQLCIDVATYGRVLRRCGAASV
jgi:hypothetical protein